VAAICRALGVSLIVPTDRISRRTRERVRADLRADEHSAASPAAERPSPNLSFVRFRQVMQSFLRGERDCNPKLTFVTGDYSRLIKPALSRSRLRWRIVRSLTWKRFASSLSASHGVTSKSLAQPWLDIGKIRKIPFQALAHSSEIPFVESRSASL